MSKNEFYYKILILSDECVGKTCFGTRYVEDHFDETP